MDGCAPVCYIVIDTYGLFRATHSHNPPRYEQAHVGLDLLTLASLYFILLGGYLSYVDEGRIAGMPGGNHGTIDRK